MKKIGEVAQSLNISIDTLRYYEKIQLLENIKRTDKGIRLYSDTDIAKVQFIQQAQKMGFSLEEIGQLLHFRDCPQTAKPQVRQLALEKLAAIKSHITELVTLRDELMTLTKQCQQSQGNCPILEKFESSKNQ
ncbi:MAG: heavy metal-responsive transcriptional regulator [Cellvibrionaceae bacterium]